MCGGTVSVDVYVIVEDGIVFVVVNCVGIDRCTGKSMSNVFLQAVYTAVKYGFDLKIVIFHICLIWPSINDS